MVGRVRVLHPTVLIAAVPNGGYRTPTEAAKLKNEGVRAGYPDLILDEARGGFFGMRVEMKRDSGGVVSSDQATVMSQLAERGYYVIVAAGADEAFHAIEEYLAWPATKFQLT